MTQLQSARDLSPLADQDAGAGLLNGRGVGGPSAGDRQGLPGGQRERIHLLVESQRLVEVDLPGVVIELDPHVIVLQPGDLPLLPEVELFIAFIPLPEQQASAHLKHAALAVQPLMDVEPGLEVALLQCGARHSRTIRLVTASAPRCSASREPIACTVASSSSRQLVSVA